MTAKYTRDDLFDFAERFVGMKELAGDEDNPQILAFLKLDADWPDRDEVPWCSGFNRGGPPDPTIIKAKGHVGFYAGHDDDLVEVLGGNQSNTVKVSRYKRDELLGVRRIAS
jgi:hypothetical protein